MGNFGIWQPFFGDTEQISHLMDVFSNLWTKLEFYKHFLDPDEKNWIRWTKQCSWIWKDNSQKNEKNKEGKLEKGEQKKNNNNK